MSKLNIVPDGHNKSVYFIMPLLGINKFSLGDGDNFINSFVSYNGKIVVVIRDPKDSWFIKHPNYLTDFNVTLEPEISATAIVYSLPLEFENDFSLFLEGKYSQFSIEAKNIIRQLSTLEYRTTPPGHKGYVTHKLLLVLDKSEVLRTWLENELKIKIEPGSELLEKPNMEEECMDIDTIVI